MKVARYKCISSDFLTVQEVESWCEESEDYLRLTEPVEIELIPLAQEDVVKAEIEVLDKCIKTIQANAEVKINGIEQRKAELLSLPAPS